MICTMRGRADLTAADVMSHCGITVRDALPLRVAADLLARTRAGWAPVVDAWGRCVGTLSAADVIRWATGRSRASRNCLGHSYVTDWHLPEPDLPAHEPVRTFMTPYPVTVPRTAGVSRLIQTVLGSGVCRTIVVDEHGRPVGVVLCSELLRHGLGGGFP
jgi:CBS-domain-containing membrane protein